MKNIILTIGISGSGKSSWTTNFIKENSNYLRINRDDIRKTLVGNLDGYYQKEPRQLNHIENIVTFTENHLFDDLISCNYNVIIDNTNLTK